MNVNRFFCALVLFTLFESTGMAQVSQEPFDWGGSFTLPERIGLEAEFQRMAEYNGHIEEHNRLSKYLAKDNTRYALYLPIGITALIITGAVVSQREPDDILVPAMVGSVIGIPLVVVPFVELAEEGGETKRMMNGSIANARKLYPSIQ